MEFEIKISQFLDSEGKIIQLPRKLRPRHAILEYLLEKFEPEHEYSEKEVNAICDQWHTFGDYFTLRRELVDNGMLARERDGSRYWRTVKNDAAENTPEQARFFPYPHCVKRSQQSF